MPGTTFGCCWLGYTTPTFPGYLGIFPLPGPWPSFTMTFSLNPDGPIGFNATSSNPNSATVAGAFADSGSGYATRLGGATGGPKSELFMTRFATACEASPGTHIDVIQGTSVVRFGVEPIIG